MIFAALMGIVAALLAILNFVGVITIYDFFKIDPLSIARKQLSPNSSENIVASFNVFNYEEKPAVFAIYSDAENPKRYLAFIATRKHFFNWQRQNIEQTHIPSGNPSFIKIDAADYDNDSYLELILIGEAKDQDGDYVYFMLFDWNSTRKYYFRDNVSEIICLNWLSSNSGKEYQQVLNKATQPLEFLPVLKMALKDQK